MKRAEEASLKAKEFSRGGKNGGRIHEGEGRGKKT